MEKIKQLEPFIKIVLLVCGISLIVMIYRLPNQIRQATKGAVIYETKTETLSTKSNFVYFKGTAQDSSFRILDHFNYNAKYPEAIYNGYLTHYEASNGSEVYIWSASDISDVTDLEGWFLSDGIATFAVLNEKNKYLDVIYLITNTEFK